MTTTHFEPNEKNPGGCTDVGVSRRHFLKAGGLAVGALTGLGLARPGTALVSVIQIYLPGGPSHLDTFDPKPDAPSEVRGEFRSISTRVPGLNLCEHLPRLAELSSFLTIVRGVTGLSDAHDPGPFSAGSTNPSHPGLSVTLAQRWGSSRKTSRGEVPTAVDLSGWTGTTNTGFAPERLGSRSFPVRHFNQLCLPLEETIALSGNTPLEHALDLGQETPGTLERYGADIHAENANFLQARRLIEAGVRYVGLAWGYWDTHGDNFGQLRRQLPLFDRGLSALIEDLRSTGRLDDVLLVAGGEFGRTPKINGGAGRDHWPRASTLLLAGGGLPHGQVLGETDRSGAEPVRPMHLENAFAPIARRLDLHPANVTTAAG